MTTISIELSDEVMQKLNTQAQKRGVAVEEMLREQAEDLVARNDRFEAAADYVLQKNAELYRRLA